MALPPDRPPPTLGRQLRAAGGLMLVLLVAAGAAYGMWWIIVGRPVLAGEKDFDFGAVPFVGTPIKLDHTFVLTNRRRRTVEIRDIKTSCGCAVAEPSTRMLESGESVEIASTLTLKGEGIKPALIYLIYDDGTKRDVLRVQGAARREQRLSVAPGPARLAPGERLERLVLYIDYDGNDPPPTPQITAPAEVRAEFTQWTQKKRRWEARGLPARWRGEVLLELAGEALPEGATVVIEVGADQKAAIPLTFE
jgi:hypothetical protein